MKTSNIAFGLITAIAFVVILIFGKAILLPLVLATMIWFLIKAIRSFMGRIKINGKVLPQWLRNTLVFAFIICILASVGMLLSTSINRMSEVIPSYEANLEKIAEALNATFGVDIHALIKEYSGNINLSSILRNVLDSLSDILGNAFLVIIYIVFILIEESAFPNKLKAIFKQKEQKEKTSLLLENMNKSINNYILVKTLVSLITGILSYIVLVSIGIDFAFFWAFLIFILNYIPTVGSLIATVFPATAAILQTGSFTPFLIVLGGVGAIQVVVGNIIEPRFMGNSLNISPLVVILSLAFWGSIWGIIGMILCVPLTVIMIKIFALFPQTRKFSVMLSKNGNID